MNRPDEYAVGRARLARAYLSQGERLRGIARMLLDGVCPECGGTGCNEEPGALAWRCRAEWADDDKGCGYTITTAEIREMLTNA